MIVKNDKGEDIEVFTKDELEAQAQERTAAEVARVEAEKQAEIDRINAEREAESKELQGLRDKDLNFKNLREAKERKEAKEANGEHDNATKAELDKINQRLAELAEQPIAKAKENFIKQNIGEDKDKKELFEYYYKKLGSDAKTEEEVEKAAQAALVLAGGPVPGARSDDGRMFSTGASQNYRNQNNGEPSEESRKIGAALGISEADRVKYGKKK